MGAMKQLKAIVRTERVADLIQALEGAGVQRIYVSHVHAFGAGVDPRSYRPSMEEGEAFTEKVAVELVCEAGDTDVLLALIRKQGCTGHRGDGLVIVSDVGDVVSVRTGEHGAVALL